MFLTISYLESAYPINPVEPLKAILYDYFGISVYFLYFIHINNNKFTYNKFKSAIFGFSILDMLFAFLISTADKEMYNIFYSPNNSIQTGQQANKHTNTHTNKHKSSFNNKDYTLAILNRGVPVSDFVRLLM